MTREKILETALRQHKMKTQRTCCLDFSENLAMDLIWDDEINLRRLWKVSAFKVCRQIKGYDVPIVSSSQLLCPLGPSFGISELKPVCTFCCRLGEAWPPEIFEAKTCQD